MQMWNDQRGLTLVELMAAVSIMVMVGAASALSLPQFLDYYRVSQARETLSAAIRQAQLEAYRTGGSWRIVVSDGVRVERSSEDRWDCAADASAWQLMHHYALISKRVNVSAQSRSCIVFGPSGRVSGTLPKAEIDDPNSPGDWISASVLVDSRYGRPVEDPWSYGNYWQHWPADGPKAAIRVDPQEERAYQAVEVGVLHSAAGGFGFPREIQVLGLRASGSTCLGDYQLLSEDGQSASLRPKSSSDPADNCPGNPPPSSLPTAEVKGRCETDSANDITLCRFTIPITGRFSALELTAVQAEGMDLYIDEVDPGDLFFTLTAGKYSRTVSVNAVTGRVISR
jgi:prepilin-type N-terminal cleavage/methylation domain-containing protein